MAEEQIFLNENGVSVSNSRMMYEGQTHAMSGITSVKSFENKPSRKGPIILIVIGILALAGGKNTIIGALIFLGGGIAWWIAQKAEYSVLLTSASGEAKAYTSKDGDFVRKIVNAVNEAIVHRG
ncbi:MAG: DUF6232 family protein [Desulfobacterales bacterium]